MRAAVKPSTFTTEGLKASDQVQSWQEWFFPAFEITPLESDGGPFKAENKLWNLGSLGVSRVSAPSVHVQRSKTNIKSVPTDHWMLAYCSHGATTFKTPKGEFTAPSGVPFFWSFGEEFESKRTRVDRVQLALPRNKLGHLAPLLDTVRGSALASPLGSLIGDYILAIERRLPTLTESDGDHLVTGLGHMIAAYVAPTAGRKEMARPGISIACNTDHRGGPKFASLAAIAVMSSVRDFPVSIVSLVRASWRCRKVHPETALASDF